MIKYEVVNQLTGLPETAETWEQAQLLQKRLIDEYMARVLPAFAVSVMIQNGDGSWTQCAADDRGQPLINGQLINTGMLG